MSSSPPPFITGAALLFWGFLTGHLAAAIPAAMLLEASSLLRIRWDFKYDAYIKAWHFSILCAALAAFLAWINGMKVWNVHIIFVWAPFILFPVEMAQRYGKADKMPLNTFSFFASRKMKQDIQEGRQVSPRMINTGYPYIAITLLATAKASRDDLLHFAGLSIIISVCLYAYMRKNGYRPWAWGSAITLMIILCFMAQWSMSRLHLRYTGGAQGDVRLNISSNEARTSIGRLGRLKLDPRILWRMTVEKGKRPPRLISAAVYNNYERAIWSHEFRASTDDQYDEFGYRDYSTAATDADQGTDIRWFTDDPPKLAKSAAITIIGRVDAKVTERPLPLPHKFLAIGDLDAEAHIECNRLGTVRLANPNYNVVEYSVWPGNLSTTEEPPDPGQSPANLDLATPFSEKEALRKVCRQLDLYNDKLSTRDKIKKLKQFFSDGFTYSTHLSTPRFDRGKRHSSIGIFLEETRSGHCEYFATAATLLLREAGIPARYCIGFAVNERDQQRNEWVMRGRHAHAWCRVWIEPGSKLDGQAGSWEEVDLTPPSWQSIDLAAPATWKRKLADWWQRTREDFLIWRTREANKTRVYTVTGSILGVMGIWIFWRLWGSRQRDDRHGKSTRYIAPENSPATPLHKLEHLAAKKIGRRPVGTPLCKWLEGMLCYDSPGHHDLEKLLIPAITLHSSIRFDPAGGATLQREELDELCAALRKAIKKIP